MTEKMFYFDYASTTPLDPRVFKKMKPFFAEQFGNPANLYSLGHRSQKAIAEALRKIISVLNISPAEFVFTGSATEADNLAIVGAARGNKEVGNKIIVSNIEHKGILSAAQALTKEGFEVVELKAGNDGRINPADLKAVLDKKTVIVSVTYTDNETGTIQPIIELAEITRNFRVENQTSYPYFHTDATQASAYLDLDVTKLGVDLMTLSAHKIYGPKGIGGLYVKKGVRLEPIIFGGGQQNRLRSGTENIPGIVGFAEALALVQAEREKETRRIKKLRDTLEEGILKRIPKVIVNGHSTRRLPNFSNVSILDIEGEAMLLYLDEKGIFVNTGSACNSQTLEPSYILTAMGMPYEFVHGSLRFSLGKGTTPASIRYVLAHLPGIVQTLRRVSPLKLSPEQKDAMAAPKAFLGGQTPHFLRKKK